MRNDSRFTIHTILLAAQLRNPTSLSTYYEFPEILTEITISPNGELFLSEQGGEKHHVSGLRSFDGSRKVNIPTNTLIHVPIWSPDSLQWIEYDLKIETVMHFHDSLNPKRVRTIKLKGQCDYGDLGLTSNGRLLTYGMEAPYGYFS